MLYKHCKKRSVNITILWSPQFQIDFGIIYIGYLNCFFFVALYGNEELHTTSPPLTYISNM